MYVHACGSQVLEDANTEDLLFFTHTHSHTHTHMTTSGEYKTHTHTLTHTAAKCWRMQMQQAAQTFAPS